MKTIKYFFEFLIICFLILIFRVMGYRLASNFGSLLGFLFGPLFRSQKLIISNIKKCLPNIDLNETKKIAKKMWSNYGRILADYIFISDFRKSKLNKYLKIEGIEILEKISKEKEPVIFISGHFNNFELMAMQIEKSGVKLAAIYRPLNNFLINKIMETIRKKYICEHQIKKGMSGVREMVKFYKKGYSIALMIDQRVSEGIKIKFFNEPAFTTTIPAQLVKKFKCKIVPIYIERTDNYKYRMKIDAPLKFRENQDIESISLDLNKWLERKILLNPEQWIWSHNRWK